MLTFVSLQKKGPRIDPQSLKNGGGASRFAGSRNRPPGSAFDALKPGGGGKDANIDKFKNFGM